MSATKPFPITAKKPFPGLNVIDVRAKLPAAIWRGLYAGSARTERIPVVRVADGHAQFILMNLEDYLELEADWQREQDQE